MVLQKKLIAWFLKDEAGATAIEYSLIAAALAACLIGAMPFITNGIFANEVKIVGALNSN